MRWILKVYKVSQISMGSLLLTLSTVFTYLLGFQHHLEKFEFVLNGLHSTLFLFNQSPYLVLTVH